eukprot:CAMPEP_0197667362 /NCGR_PEP_ID=MMETSP1338-20131121/66050_1 /TAXON_ID=43686 ORGANISM="Pelagodinium beii, Strain RCC1491" /NCGR_SAMPLE_ID=MMETSP1338 /ASSEMBLY_ACC=CAM_ASM_000754 /LENGTH=190 /DNA_ID=CAMNT_0043246579 /DNA_START=79 /DNA_END=651 /DNA_ORIENTATION=-
MASASDVTVNVAAGAGAGAGSGAAGAGAGVGAGAKPKRVAQASHAGSDLAPTSEQEAKDQGRKYKALLDKWNRQPSQINKPQRTGWTKVNPNYRPCLWGSDPKDWFLICCCFAVLYTLLGLFYFLLLRFYLVTFENHLALWINFILLAVMAITLAVMVSAGNRERAKLEQAQADKDIEMASKAMAASKAN